jgi:hypothetical protein
MSSPHPSHLRRVLLAAATAALLLASAPTATAQLLANDSWVSGQALNFQGGFIAGETAAVRLVPAGPCPCQVDEVRFLFGGSGGTHDVTLRIWDDAAGAPAPGTLIYSETVQLTGTNDFMQSIDLRPHAVMVDGPFRVGLEFTHDGFPSMASDIGDIDNASNFIDEATFGWVPSYLLGLTGDWIIRALVDSGTPGGGVVLANDGWVSGQNVAFQGGFAVGETAAVRLEPVGPCPCRLDKLQFLFGGAGGTLDVTFRIWDDSALTDAPGAELYSTTIAVTGSNEFMQEVDISAVGLMISGPVRVGLEFSHAGLPSVARDDDGIQPDRNFIDETTLGWVESSTQGLTGDWIIRGVLDTVTAPGGTLVNNDTWIPGQPVAFQGGFLAGETAAVRLTPPGPCPCPVERIQFLFGGAAGTHDVTLHIWDDSAGTVVPGSELYAATFTLAGSDEFMQEIDISVLGLMVNGPFRVGLEFSHAGPPSVARDTDGIQPDRNFIDDLGSGWVESSTQGLTGDWIIRAVLPAGPATGELVSNDTWIPGQTVAFQSGFAVGETAAARFVPTSPCPCGLDQIRFLFGGDPGTETIILHVWDDSGLTLAPGTEIYSSPIQLTGSDFFLQELDLTVAGITVNGPFRVGFEFQHSGPPSVARDDDGITANRNFIDDLGSGWVEASSQGITGDWVMRAVLDSLPAPLLAADSFASAASAVPQAGLVQGDTPAVRLVPQGTCPCRIEDVRFLLSGSSSDQVVTLRIWEDAAGTDAPGSELHARDISLTPSSQALQVVSLHDEVLWVDGPFRVGVELRSDAPPSIAVDDDGVTPGASFLLESGSGWSEASAAGVGGDWVIRATATAAAGQLVPGLAGWGIAALVAAMILVVVYVGRRAEPAESPPA